MAAFNHLKNETSPYLKQHADNPVDWYPWGEEAFNEAERRGVPIFLSIGYSTCHWCHVMERESFTDQETAALINKYFVAVKVDREERPDIDQVYMDVCKAMTGSGGWPLSIFMTADKKPFFAATYIPREDKYGRKGLLSLLPQIYDLWMNDRGELLNSSQNVINHLKKEQNNSQQNLELDQEIITETLNILSKIYDEEYAGFGSEPKFPMPHYLIFLLDQWQENSENKYLEMTETSLDSMRAGGIFDQLGGGFHRYSTDREWDIPHFEKMLYDQALLIYSYAEAYQITNKNIYLETINKTAAYLKREMRDENGCFYSAEDADSEGIEGEFYFWEKEEIENILSETEYQEFLEVFKVQNQKRITLSLKQAQDFAKLPEIKAKLFEKRKKRIRPAKDKKILTDWNGLAVAGLAKAGFVTNNPEYISMAEKNADFIFENMRDQSGNLIHSYYQDSFSKVDNLNDYAYLLWAFVELYQATLKNKYLIRAEKIVNKMIDRFWDQKSGGFYFTAVENDELFLRQKKNEDSAIPSANSIASYNMLKLSHLLDNYDLREKVDQMLSSFASEIMRSPVSHIYMLLSLKYLENPFKKINIYGSLDDPQVKELLAYLRHNYNPKILLNSSLASDKSGFSLCSNFVCGEITDDLNDIISDI
ncbi:Thymidylate kinase [Halanaerobium saccharolyticum subsp. saccharolyticum DSM 6643]|uniref:Thymidylate kinase n=1 Tax=Halanaerobium saccharolyticum subsp. saccharolyticum DSM 6643 TaxID=1293054 RepID=M5DYE9_9FIRM|nr:thioredoxin domain-containing protein [Halanaerobium saccharolyticum]CCU78624.1 Thymidylate kinase [Halanaerobium saccharolyticum subsp. saccharolyticum DSM 6643]